MYSPQKREFKKLTRKQKRPDASRGIKCQKESERKKGCLYEGLQEVDYEDPNVRR